MPMNGRRDEAGVLAVITARGGSKSIPKKNLADLGGLPLVAHTIRQAAAATTLTRTVVSTDSVEIAAVFRRETLLGGRLWGDDCRGVPMPAERSLDIDEPADLLLARALDELSRRQAPRP